MVSQVLKAAPVLTAYLFGSVAKGHPGPLSDYDFAVHLEPGLTSEQKFRYKLDLITRLTKALRQDNVDVVLLNDAPPLLAHRILKEGIVLFCRDPRARVRKEFELLTAYLDFKEDLDLYAQATLSLKPQRSARAPLHG